VNKMGEVWDSTVFFIGTSSSDLFRMLLMICSVLFKAIVGLIILDVSLSVSTVHVLSGSAKTVASGLAFIKEIISRSIGLTKMISPSIGAFFILKIGKYINKYISGSR